MSDLLIKTEKLCKTFHHDGIVTPVLFDVDMQVCQGEFVAVMGPSGCGKSTLMHILGLMLSPSGGDIVIDGCSAAGLNEAARAKIRREKIGFVFQRFNLLPTVSGYDNIAVAERIRGNAVDGQVDAALAAVAMTEKAHFKPGRLSMGQQQRIAIARAIIHRPRIVMADEPTGNLDSTNAKTILELFRQIHRERGITIFLITHSLTAAQYADRIICMADGKIQDVS